MLRTIREQLALLIARLRAFTRRIKQELLVWRLVLKDARTPWYAKALLWFGIAYALMPFDLIPDFLPVLGFLDDVLLVGVPIALAIRLIPKEIIEQHRESITPTTLV
ncbi:MAG: DUF1232 domain-containing protein [Dehalococcoidia bacterium]